MNVSTIAGAHGWVAFDSANSNGIPWCVRSLTTTTGKGPILCTQESVYLHICTHRVACVSASTRLQSNMFGSDPGIAVERIVFIPRGRFEHTRHTHDEVATWKSITLSRFSCFSGAVHASASTKTEVVGMISFVENTAILDGGAISLEDPTEVEIIGALFVSNEAAFGGAVSVRSAVRTTGWFERCRFDSSNASNGGALYLSTGGTNATESSIIVQDSAFLHNVAGESPIERSNVLGVIHFEE